MGEQHSVPTGDGTWTEWSIEPTSPTTHYDKIDEPWMLPNTSDYIHATTDYVRDQFTFPADGPAAMKEVHTIHVDLYVNTVMVTDVPALSIGIYLGTTYHVGESFNCNTGGEWKRAHATFDGLSLTKAQYNTVRILVRKIPGDPGYPNIEFV